MTRERDLSREELKELAELRELVELLPAPSDPVLSDGRAHQLEEHLMDEISRQPAARPASEPADGPPARRPYRRLALIGAPLALALAAGGIAVLGPWTDGGDNAPETGGGAPEARGGAPETGGAPEAGGGAPTVTGPLTLAQAAQYISHAAATRDAPVPEPGQFIYRDLQGIAYLEGHGPADDPEVTLPNEPGRHESWISPDGYEGMSIWEDRGCSRIGSRWHAYVETEPEDPIIMVPDEPPGCDETPKPGEGLPDEAEPTVRSYDWLASLPTDPEALLDWLYEWTEGEGNGPDEAVFEAIRELVSDSPMPPTLEGAMYEAASLVPGAVLVEESVDALGREGIAIARTEKTRSQRTELIFDAETYEYLGERIVLTKDFEQFEAGDVIGGSAVAQWAVVDEMGQRPADATT